VQRLEPVIFPHVVDALYELLLRTVMLDDGGCARGGREDERCKAY
jgi:23S rRNA maturation mini-RNase III